MAGKGSRWLFLENFGRLLRMNTEDAEKQAHGRALRAAMAGAGMNRDDVAELVGKKPRTITNWTSGSTMPDAQDLEVLRRRFPGYDSVGDQVEAAIERSELDDWRKADLTAQYRKHLHEQRKEATG